MSSLVITWFAALDSGVAALLFPLGLAILISGLDDLALIGISLWQWLRGARPTVTIAAPEPGAPQKRIAIFIPLWHEHKVIAGMVEHNVSAIDYDNYHFFVGAYPNDEPTLDAVRELESRFPHVHMAVCPHDGPTSKSDCLNWIYQRMLLFEEQHALTFDVVVIHDAEDLIHAQALALINGACGEFDMVQVPVLPLPTPFRDFVHGIYCDEFAEWQIKDMPARQFMGSFVPSNGVGTGFTREALEKLAQAEHNLIFEPACLTEDYENGLRLHRLGCRQTFVVPARCGSTFLATREYFPRTIHGAIRQRTRWITGIALQTWERHGWSGSLPQIYWYWRDRKGLFGNPLSLVTNLLFAYGALTWLFARFAHIPWGLGEQTLPTHLLVATSGIQIVQSAVRVACCARIYGLAFALGAPIRTVFANWINTVATLRAVHGYFRARILRQPLVWLKTEHVYPSRNALMEHKRKLGEILVGSGYVEESDLERALTSRPSGMRVGEWLVRRGKITEEELYEALSLQHSLPGFRVEPHRVSRTVARSLPRHVVRDWRVLPFRIASGSMFVASPELPTDELGRTLRTFTRLELRFHLVTPSNFEELTAELL